MATTPADWQSKGDAYHFSTLFVSFSWKKNYSVNEIRSNNDKSIWHNGLIYKISKLGLSRLTIQITVQKQTEQNVQNQDRRDKIHGESNNNTRRTKITSWVATLQH